MDGKFFAAALFASSLVLGGCATSASPDSAVCPLIKNQQLEGVFQNHGSWQGQTSTLTLSYLIWPEVSRFSDADHSAIDAIAFNYNDETFQLRATAYDGQKAVSPTQIVSWPLQENGSLSMYRDDSKLPKIGQLYGFNGASVSLQMTCSGDLIAEIQSRKPGTGKGPDPVEPTLAVKRVLYRQMK